MFTPMINNVKIYIISIFSLGFSILLCAPTCKTHIMQDRSMEDIISAPDGNVLEHLTDNEVKIATIKKQKATATFRFGGVRGVQ